MSLFNFAEEPGKGRYMFWKLKIVESTGRRDKTVNVVPTDTANEPETVSAVTQIGTCVTTWITAVRITLYCEAIDEYL